MYAKYRYHSGNDLEVVNAARVSFNNMSEWEDEDPLAYFNGSPTMKLKSRDEKLIRYLADHNHWTPFAHNSITLRMKAPLPIRTQCFKHKYGFVENEESRRYISNDVDVYLPDLIRGAPVNGAKQGSSGTHPHSEDLRTFMAESFFKSVRDYNSLIEAGVCPEQARFVLPQGAQVEWIWTGSLAAYARFYRLRNHKDAQAEIAELAGMVSVLIEPHFPVSWKALTES